MAVPRFGVSPEAHFKAGDPGSGKLQGNFFHLGQFLQKPGKPEDDFLVGGRVERTRKIRALPVA